MAISRSKSSSIAETLIDKPDLKPLKKGDSIKKVKKTKGLLASTIEELKKVDWPDFVYVIRWSVVTIIFTAFISLFLGYPDRVFTAGLKLVDCTKPLASENAESGLLKNCSQDFLKKVTFRDK
jgi:preprotein translocase SecE subunit